MREALLSSLSLSFVGNPQMFSIHVVNSKQLFCSQSDATADSNWKDNWELISEPNQCNMWLFFHWRDKARATRGAVALAGFGSMAWSWICFLDFMTHHNLIPFHKHRENFYLGLLVRLLVYRLSQKVANGSEPNLVDMLGVRQGRIDSILQQYLQFQLSSPPGRY